MDVGKALPGDSLELAGNLSLDAAGQVLVGDAPSGVTLHQLSATRWDFASAQPASTDVYDTILNQLALGSTAATQPAGTRAIALQAELRERVRAQDRASRFISLIQSSDEFISMASLDGEILFINDGGRRMLGIDPDRDLKTLRLRDYHTPDGLRRIEDLRTSGRFRGQGQLRHLRTGQLIDTQVSSFLMRDANGEPLGYATVQHDIRETKRLEAQLRAGQKMEAIGTLAGGIAHDFNNILGGSSATSRWHAKTVGPTPRARGTWRRSQKAGRRATGLVQQILTFSRRREPHGSVTPRRRGRGR